MTYIATVTEKGQVTIPAEIRKLLAIHTGDQIAFAKHEKQVVIKPAKGFISLKGSIRSSVIYHDENADNAVNRYIRKTYAQKASSS